MRITPELISHCAQRINAIKQRELNMAGLKIPVIENLGATLDFYDFIDFSDNEIVILSSFSILKNLRTLNLTNNHISKIENISQAFPELESLVLVGNRIEDLKQIDNLSFCRNLVRLYMLNNPITEDKNYRYYVIHRCPDLKVLDFQRIKKFERQKAKELYGDLSLPSQREKLAKMTKKEKIKLAIEKAKTIEEVNQLSMLLKIGELSEAILDQKLIEYKIF